MRSRFVAMYWLMKESSSSIRVTMYSVAEEGQVKRLGDASCQLLCQEQRKPRVLVIGAHLRY